MRRLFVPVLFSLALIASACSALAPRPIAAAAPAGTSLPTVPAGIDPFAPPANGLVRVDQQGAVTVEITPPDLRGALETLDFQVALNTHSVDLSMDLAGVSTLSTDTGLSVSAGDWDAPRGGHHVRGTLRFPALQDGKSILLGARKLTLTILGVDAAARVFEWDLQ